VADVGGALQRRELVDDDLGLGARDGAHDRVAVQRVGHHRQRAGGAQALGLARRAGHRDDFVSVGEQRRHQPAAHRSCCSCDQDPHGPL